MKIKYLTTMAGTDYVRQKGDIVEVTEAEGVRLLEAGFAELIEAEVKPPAKKRTTRKTKK